MFILLLCILQDWIEKFKLRIFKKGYVGNCVAWDKFDLI